MTDTQDFTVYEPDNSLKKGYRSLFSDIFHEINKNRWLIFQLFKRDFLALYKQSFLGFFWAVILPLVSVATFLVLSGAGVFNIGAINVPYPLYAILGMAFWQLFSTGVVANSNSLVAAGGMITKINFSKKSLVIASTGQSLLSFVIQLCLVVALLLYYHIAPSPFILLIPLLAVPIVLFTLGLGFILALLNGVMRDISNILAILVTFLLLLTPVLYAKPTTGLLATLSTYNILYYLVSVPRDLALFGTTANLNAFVLSAVIACVVFTLCLGVFHLTEARVAERI
jgi:lipopolysaccharide transport system permease protein